MLRNGTERLRCKNSARIPVEIERKFASLHWNNILVSADPIVSNRNGSDTPLLEKHDRQNISNKLFIDWIAHQPSYVIYPFPFMSAIRIISSASSVVSLSPKWFITVLTSLALINPDELRSNIRKASFISSSASGCRSRLRNNLTKSVNLMLSTSERMRKEEKWNGDKLTWEITRFKLNFRFFSTLCLNYDELCQYDPGQDILFWSLNYVFEFLSIINTTGLSDALYL